MALGLISLKGKDKGYLPRLLKRSNPRYVRYCNKDKKKVFFMEIHIRRCIQKPQDNAHNTQVACS